MLVDLLVVGGMYGFCVVVVVVGGVFGTCGVVTGGGGRRVVVVVGLEFIHMVSKTESHFCKIMLSEAG